MDQFFNLVADTQRCRLDDQRVSIEVLPGLRLTSNSVQDTEMDQLFNLVTNAQRSRLDDQRVSIETLPGLHISAGSDQNGQVKMATGQTANKLNSMVRMHADSQLYALSKRT
uniref:Uncharacterized protein n=1 Tax=Paramormyrops kingsleyae TaxID=1676925 RepID=A0A3B3T0C6_9TELE